MHFPEGHFSNHYHCDLKLIGLSFPSMRFDYAMRGTNLSIILWNWQYDDYRFLRAVRTRIKVFLCQRHHP